MIVGVPLFLIFAKNFTAGCKSLCIYWLNKYALREQSLSSIRNATSVSIRNAAANATANAHAIKKPGLYQRRRLFLKKSGNKSFMEPFISLASILIIPFPTYAVRTMSTNCWVSEVAELWLFATHCFTSLVQDSFSGKKQELKQEVHLKVRHLHETNALTYSPQTIPAAS